MTVTCYVDPKNPSRSVIQRWSNAIWFGLLPLAFLAGGLLFIRSVAQRPFGTVTPDSGTGRLWPNEPRVKGPPQDIGPELKQSGPISPSMWKAETVAMLEF
jgi:hypothetical protein